MSRYLIVELEPDLEHLPNVPLKVTRSAVFRGILQVPGVRSISDIAFVSRESMDAWLMPPEQVVEELPPPRKRAKARTA